MMNGKSIGVAAGIGFALSFLTGLISKNAIGTTFLRAFVFALVFAALAAAVSFLYDKFLSDGSDSPASEPVSSGGYSGNTGSRVDIVVSDDNLDDDDSGPKFYVENNRSSLAGGSDLRSKQESSAAATTVSADAEPQISNVEALSSETVEESPAVPVTPAQAPVNQSFQPVSLGGENRVAADDAINPANPAKRTEDSGEDVDNTGAIDSVDNIEQLPEIGDFNEKKSDDDSNIISDSDFARGSGAGSGPSLPGGKSAGEMDTDVMAKAIHTLLAQDNN